MIDVKTSVLGDEQLKAEFAGLESTVRASVRARLLGLAQQAQNVARAAAPKREGNLAEAIRVAIRETARGLTVTVKPFGRENFIGRLMEYGVVSHGTDRNSSRSQRKGPRAKFNLAAAVRAKRAAGEYRVTARPFMAQAEPLVRAQLDRTVQEALDSAVREA